MPARVYPKRKRSFVKKPYKRVVRSRKPIMRRRSTNRMLRTIVPPSLSTRLRYMDYFNFNTAGSAYYTKAFRMNGAFDPDAAVGGGACTGFSQLANIYGKYRVMGSKIEVWAYNTCNSPVIVSVFARSSTGGVPTSATEVQQKSFEYNSDVKSRQMLPFTTGNGYPRTYLSMYKSIRRLEGNRINVDEDYTAATTTTPSLQTYWDVNLCSLDGSAISSTANYTVRITYYIRFYEPVIAYTD